MKEILVNKRKVQLAESFDELKLKQLLQFIRLVYSRFHEVFKREGEVYKVADITLYYSLRVSFLFILMRISRRTFFRISKEAMHELIELHRLADFGFTGVISKCPIPHLKSRRFLGYRLYPPDDKFEVMNAEEFGYADGFYLRYKRTKKEEALDTLVAILYREEDENYDPEDPRTTGDRRVPFNNHSIDHRIKIMKRLRQEKKLAVMLWYEGYRSTLPKKYPHIFTTSNEARASSGGGWYPVFRALSGKKFGSYQDTVKIPHKVFLDQMQDDLIEIKEWKEKHKIQ